MRLRRDGTVLVWLAALVAVCGLGLALRSWSPGGAEEAPSVGEARAALDGVIDDADSAERLCEWASSKPNCDGMLQGAGPPPAEAPELRCWGEYAPGEGLVPGLILRVSGEGADGQAYESDLLALRVGPHVRFINPVYWTGTRVSATGVSGSYVDLDCDITAERF